jgi:soluble lytic murein transglycosylase-like protein
MARWKREDEFDAIVQEKAQKYMVPAALIKGVIAQESAFKPDALREEPRLRTRSRGLMQLLETTANALGYRGPTVELHDPEKNIELGVKLLAQNFKQANGDWDVALSAYNAGFSSLRPWDAKRKPDGRMINEDYVRRVRGNWEYFRFGAVPNLVGLLVVAVLSWFALRQGW